MADGMKRTGGEPAFDTDRAWERFKSTAGREPASAFWTQEEEVLRSDDIRMEAIHAENQTNHEKEGAVEMKQKDTFQATPEFPTDGAAGTAITAKGKDGRWQTERPARRRLRRLAIVACAAVMTVSLFTTSLGDRALAFMQQSFRIQHVVGIGITADDMATISEVLDKGSPEGDQSFSLAQYGSLTQTGGGKSTPITWEEADQRMGAPLYKLESSSAPVYSPAGTLTLNLNVEAVNRLLTRLGSTTILPAEANGKAIRLHAPHGITTEGALSGKPVRLLQFGKPELIVEDGIDTAAVRDAILGLPVLPDSLRTKLAAIGDWQTTLPVPVRDGASTSLRLGGHDAIMTVDGTKRLLFWLDGDRMGLLAGNMNDFPAEADFQHAAEELIRP
jgi:hypothetical protein